MYFDTLLCIKIFNYFDHISVVYRSAFVALQWWFHKLNGPKERNVDRRGWLLRFEASYNCLATRQEKIAMYNSFIVGVPLSGGWAPTVYHQFKDNEGGERRRLNDHRLILTNQRLPGTAYVTHCFHVSPPALHYRTSSKKGFCIHHSSWLI
jgi:hypothetical protein